MPADVDIRLRVWWPLIIIPIALLNQILAPHAVWLVLLVTLSGLYSAAYLWVRFQAPYITAQRGHTSSILVTGDTLTEEYTLFNNSWLPVLWVEYIDNSDLPGHSTGQVVACGVESTYRWREKVVCERRGVFRLGPHRLRLSDPFGLFDVHIASSETEVLLIYPRVAHLPEFELPHGDSGESQRRRRPFYGALPSASITDYRPGDSIRKIHWPSTARRGQIMVKELDSEPSGDVWIVLDLNGAEHTGAGAKGTLEFSVIIAASLAAKLLSRGDRAVGLLAVSGTNPVTQFLEDGSTTSAASDTQTILIAPQPSQAQMWSILAALASVEACHTPIATVLHNSREYLGNRGSVIVITPELPNEGSSELNEGNTVAIDRDASGDMPTNGENESQYVRPQSWLSELVRLQVSGVDAAAMLIATTEDTDDSVSAGASHFDGVRSSLAMVGIQSTVLYTDTELSPALTFRRIRQEIRSTPTGGAITVEIEEEVG